MTAPGLNRILRMSNHAPDVTGRHLDARPTLASIKNPLPPSDPMGFVPSSMKVVSSAFQYGGAIPTKYTGEGVNVSPPLDWSDPPEGTKGFAVICHDPDAPLIRDGTYGWVHWVLHGLPATTRSLEEGTDEGIPGAHDGGGRGYSGPMPPEGHGKHLYYFWVLALDENLQLQPGLTLWGFLERAEPHVIGMSRLVGTYER